MRPRLMHTFRRRPKPWVRAVPTPPLDGAPLAVVVIAHKMTHEVGNTIRSLLPPVQQNITTDRYEIHLIDNGSPDPLSTEIWNQSPIVKYRHVPPAEAPVNPGVAINRAVAGTRSPTVCVMIDGARMVTPGVIRWGLDLATLSPKTVVEVRGWHLGSQLQNVAVQTGYDAGVEKQLLDSIGWPADPYRLFDVAVPAAASPGGFAGTASESTCLFLSRGYFDQLGGYDERYAEPGGGLCNADFFVRAVAGADRVFSVLGEGTFHQIHGGAATGLTGDGLRASHRRWKAEYEKLSRPWHNVPVEYRPIVAGHLPGPARRWMTGN